MRRVGTISSALGLIYLGVWMIIGKINGELAKEIFKWWPGIIIILGIEVLLQFTRNNNERTKINFWIVPVLIVLLIINMFQGMKFNFGNIFNYDTTWRITRNYNTKKVSVAKTLPVYGKKIQFYCNNAKVNVIKSKDNNIRIEGSVYIHKNENKDSYEILEKKDDMGYSIKIDESYVDSANVSIYIPNGYDIKVISENLNFNSKDSLMESRISVEGESCNINISEAKDVILSFNTGNIDLEDIKSLKLEGDSGNIDLDGNVENIYLRCRSGKVHVKNEICTNIDISVDSGLINFDTKDKNIKIDAEISSGICSINGEKVIDSSITKSFGEATGNVKIKMDSGVIRVTN